jgi:hypothetical protein
LYSVYFVRVGPLMSRSVRQVSPFVIGTHHLIRQVLKFVVKSTKKQ